MNGGGVFLLYIGLHIISSSLINNSGFYQRAEVLCTLI